MQQGLTLEQATGLLLERVKAPAQPETVPLLDGFGRVSFKDVRATLDHPPFDRSPFDGYAVFHEDLAHASTTTPVTLKIHQRLFAGDISAQALQPGEAALVMTGAPLPTGATCVVRREDVCSDGGNEILISMPLRKYQNYRFRGEEIKGGQRIATKGERLNAAEIGMLAGQGLTHIDVFPSPTVGILATGSELIPGGLPLGPGKIHDSNKFLLAARVKALGGIPVLGGDVADDPAALANSLRDLLDRSDLAISTGGTSMGDRDYMPVAGGMMGANMLFTRFAPKPGGQTLAMEKNGKIIVCLPGNPFAAATSFELLVRPVIKSLAGEAQVFFPRVQATLHDPFPEPSNFRRLIGAHIEGSQVFLPMHGRAAITIAALSHCNCIVDIPAGTPPLTGGEIVNVVLL